MLSYFTRGYQKLSSPRFDRAPWQELKFSGTSVRFKNPRQTVYAGPPVFRTDWDLYEAPAYGENRFYSRSAIDTPSHLPPQFFVDGEGKWHVTAFKTGWVYDPGALRWGSGILICTLFVLRRAFEQRPANDNERSFFHQDKLERWIPYWCARPSEEQVPATIECIEHNGVHWSGWSLGGKMGGYSEYEWFTAISDDHVLNLLFEPSDNFDGNPKTDTNFVPLYERTIQTFMENFHIKLSADAEARRRHVLSL